METLRRHPPAIDLSTVDQRAYLRDLDWKGLLGVLRARGDTAANRIVYADGVLEIMSPSWNHELIKKNVARLLEAWALKEDVPLNGYGSWTLKNARSRSAIEPDECYVLGKRGAAPDLAIEIRWTRGGVEKLPVYARLGVKEVWVWADGTLVPWVLRGSSFVRAARSALLPELDLKLLAKHSLTEDQGRAVRAFLKASR